MVIMTRVALALSLLVSPAVANDGDVLMSPMMQQAMRSVEEHCRWDVSSLCSVPGGDPIMELFGHPVSPVIEHSLSHMLNSMMDTAIRLSDEQPTFVWVSLHDETPSNTQEIDGSEQVFDSMVTSLADHVASISSDEAEEATEEKVNTPVWDPVEFSKRLVEHGEHAMAQAQAEGDEHRHRLARRLTEVHPSMFHGPQDGMHLPFGCRKNRCLMAAYDQGAVSPRCADALRRVEEVKQHVEVSQHQMFVIEHEQETFLGLAVLYGILCLGTLLLLHRRLSKLGRRMRGKHRLKRRILQAVYNNPEIKAAVAAELNENLGLVPPLPPHVLADMSGKSPHYNWRLMRFLKLLVLTGILVLAFVNPMLAMPVMCVLIGIRFIHIAFCPPKIPKEECSCCCCGASTEDVANGNLTAAQECCTCCKGTGVCSPNCASCCGDNGNGCCGKGCCCCGATEEDAAAGNLTALQACCCCCNGTGKCCGSSGCCCGSCCSEKTVSKRPVRHAEKKAYMGIPVQVV